MTACCSFLIPWISWCGTLAFLETLLYASMCAVQAAGRSDDHRVPYLSSVSDGRGAMFPLLDIQNRRLRAIYITPAVSAETFLHSALLHNSEPHLFALADDLYGERGPGSSHFSSTSHFPYRVQSKALNSDNESPPSNFLQRRAGSVLREPRIRAASSHYLDIPFGRFKRHYPKGAGESGEKDGRFAPDSVPSTSTFTPVKVTEILDHSPHEHEDSEIRDEAQVREVQVVGYMDSEPVETSTVAGHGYDAFLDSLNHRLSEKTTITPTAKPSKEQEPSTSTQRKSIVQEVGVTDLQASPTVENVRQVAPQDTRNVTGEVETVAERVRESRTSTSSKVSVSAVVNLAPTNVATTTSTTTETSTQPTTVYTTESTTTTTTEAVTTTPAPTVSYKRSSEVTESSGSDLVKEMSANTTVASSTTTVTTETTSVVTPTVGEAKLSETSTSPTPTQDESYTSSTAMRFLPIRQSTRVVSSTVPTTIQDFTTRVVPILQSTRVIQQTRIVPFRELPTVPTTEGDPTATPTSRPIRYPPWKTTRITTPPAPTVPETSTASDLTTRDTDIVTSTASPPSTKRSFGSQELDGLHDFLLMDSEELNKISRANGWTSTSVPEPRRTRPIPRQRDEDEFRFSAEDFGRREVNNTEKLATDPSVLIADFLDDLGHEESVPVSTARIVPGDASAVRLVPLMDSDDRLSPELTRHGIGESETQIVAAEDKNDLFEAMDGAQLTSSLDDGLVDGRSGRGLNVASLAPHHSGGGGAQNTKISELMNAPSDLKIQLGDNNPLAASAIVGIVAAAAAILLTVTAALGFLIHRRPSLLGLKTLNNKLGRDNCTYVDDSLRVNYVNNHMDYQRDPCEEMLSLDNDSFLNSLEAMTVTNYWAEGCKSTKV